MKRQIELDFFRGIALLVIFWDHLHWYVRVGSPVRYGFSDAATVFIFLSGYVAGLVYDKVYKKDGFSSALVKAGRRSLQIYTAHIIALAVVLIIAALSPEGNNPNPMHTFFYKFTGDSYNLIWQILSLQYFPQLFDILPLYVLLVLAVPFVLALLKKNWWLVLLLALTLYVATQFFPLFNIQTFFPSWSLNPTSWFFLFVIGITVAVKTREGVLQIPLKSLYVFFAACFLIYAFADLTLVNRLLQLLGVVTEETKFLFPSPFPFTGKTLLQPVSLLHFLCLAYVVSYFTPKLNSFYNSWFARPFVKCGQHSLTLFSTGIVLTYLFTYLIIFFELDDIYFFIFAALGFAVTILLAGYLSYRKKLVRMKLERFPLQQPEEIPVNRFSVGDEKAVKEQIQNTRPIRN